MTLKRLLLGLLTLLAIVIMGNSLLESWNKPQIQSQLELRQTDLLLQASLLDSEASAAARQFQNALLGMDPIKASLRDYQKARQQTGQIKSQVVAKPDLSNLQARLALRIGILQTQQQAVSAAITTWKTLETLDPPPLDALSKTATVLTGLWQEPPSIVPQAESLLQANLTGWFRYQALARLYNVTQQTDRLLDLQTTAQTQAQQAMIRLITLAVIPSMGVVVGGSILLVLILQALFKGKASLLASLDISGWSVPWDGEVVWQVFILGFFWLGQFLVPYLILPALFSVLQLNPPSFGERDRALWILINYSLVALAGLLTLYGSIKPYHPLSSNWFRLNWRSPWLLWGAGGYLVATPIVILVSLLNQQLWRGQGGSNPILPIALDSGDPVAIACFFTTASLAAPLFEEIMFRGFLLPSLTRYLPAWGAIGVSSLLFALAHLSVSEVLPLTALGCVLGFVYLRSRSLLAPILLHGLWNGGTLISLVTLGSS